MNYFLTPSEFIALRANKFGQGGRQSEATPNTGGVEWVRALSYTMLHSVSCARNRVAVVLYAALA